MPTCLCPRRFAFAAPSAQRSLSPTSLRGLYPPSESQEMIEEADRNGDGQIDEEEFYRIMKKTSLF